MKIRFSMLGVALLCAAVGGNAMTLGRVRGALAVGQPLDVAIPVQLAPEENAAQLCFEAEVYYGEVRQEARRVSAKAQAIANGSSVVVRVVAENAIDEPVVTLRVRSTCDLRMGREYVLLADFVDDKEAAAVAEPAGPVAQLQPRALPVPAAAAPVVASAPVAPVAPVAPARDSQSEAKVVKPVAVAAPKKVNAQARVLLVAPMVLAPLAPVAGYNNADFVLAYEAMLGASDLSGALTAARQGVANRPQDAAWRRRLAQVADWTQQPALAAENWSALFVMGDHSNGTVAAVLRLAPLIEDPHIALQAWALKAAQAPLTVAQWADVLALYEQAGEPAQGSKFFEAQFRTRHLIQLLEYAARLAENSGDDERSLALDLERSELTPYSTEDVLQFTARLVRMDHLPEALKLMHRHSGAVPDDSPVYWRLMGELAWQVGDNALAQRAYGAIAPTSKGTAADWTRLIYLMRQDHPAQAAELAMGSYRRFEQIEYLFQALDLYVEMGDVGAQDRVFESLTSKELVEAQDNPRFLSMRAQWHQRKKRVDLAYADLMQALAQAPDDNERKLGLLWFLIDQQRLPALQTAMNQYRAVAWDDASFWLAFAAGSQILGQTRDSLSWYGKEVRQHPDDPLMLLSFADALETSQQHGLAARIRRHAWALLHQKPPAGRAGNATSETPELLAVARMAIANQPGDPAMQVVRQLAEKMRGLPSDQTDAQTSELVLGWALAKEQYSNARAWMWLRYARQTASSPLWAQSQLLLQQEDKAGMRQLLAEQGKALPVVNHYDMAMAVGEVREALDLVPAGMAQLDAREPLAERVRQHAPLYANYVQVTASAEGMSAQVDPKGQTGTLDTRGLEFEARVAPWALLPQVQLIAGWSHHEQSSDNPFFYDPLPSVDRLHRLELRMLAPEGQSSLAVFQRSAASGSEGLQLAHAWRWGQRFNLDAGFDYHAPSTLSVPMRLTGFENKVLGSVNYALSKREYLRVGPSMSEYFSQTGESLGSGSQIEVEAGYRIRSDYPDWRVRILGSRQLLDARQGTDPLVIPDSATTWSLCVDMGNNLAGQNVRTVYSGAWRPFVDVCMLNNMSTGGDGYSATAGFVGSITGRDHLSLELQNSEDSAAGSANIKALSLRYRYYF